MGVFSGYQIAVELTSYVPLKTKQELRKLITTNDGIVSFIVTKKCKLLVTSHDEERAKDSFKCQTAMKFNIPVVQSRYVFDCVKTGHLVDPDPYVLMGNTKHHLLASGVIAASQGRNSVAKSVKKTGFINLNSVKVWNLCDKNGPSFPEDSYKVARSIQLIKSDKKLFFVAEIHVAPSADQFKYRIFTHSGVLTSSHYQEKEPDVDFGKACRYSNSADECLQIYSRICDLQMEAPNLFTKTREYLGKNIGSRKFQQMQLELLMNTTGLDEEVRKLVEYIWKEAVGELQDIIAGPINSIKTDQVDKAESVLLELKRLLDIDAKHDEIQKLSNEFYAHLAQNAPHQTPINTKHLISKKQELCQLIRDVISVSEGTNWSQRCPSESKYKALRCHIKHLKANSPAYNHINQHILGSQKGKSDVEVLSVFEISRSIEESVFNEKMNNKRLLFHSSHAHNFVGILSRGLLLPKVIVDDCGGTRTDVGFLGSGIYFADDASTSAKYSRPSKCKGSRLMLVNEVALGKCFDLFKHQTELSAAPTEYDSVHGVRATNDVKSDFKDDEYAIYDTNQQRLRYLIEFKLRDDVLKALDVDKNDNIVEDEVDVSAKKTADSVELSDVQNISDPLLKVKAGLVSDSSVEIPLTAVHVKARLIDLAAQVIIFQHYKNESNRPIEAKYVFPLDESAAVCGFEAFINDKHIVGEVKEKETAHREYREAISQGHGAYLMDQDEETPEVFTVSVGNLPPQCDVMIKIMYVSELQMEGENVFFRIPSCVAPWKKSVGLETVTQSELETVRITEDEIETSIQVAIEMPFEIKEVDCTTHRIRLKKTDTKAVVEMQKNQRIDEGFQLLISLAEIHVPRMWVEQLPDSPDSRACMLTFYPEFEATISDNYEVIFLLDLSNSMKGNSLLEAKKILHLLLFHLPESCLFNVIVFGTDYVELFPCSRVKNPANVQLAEKFVKSQDATMDNTDVIQLLSSLYLLCPDDGFRNLFLISDGHISNEQVTLEAARLNCHHSRLFTFGVGSIANHHVLRRLATAGCGYYEYFNSKMKSKWERKIRNQLSKAAQPSLSSIEVNWHNFNNMGTPVQAPAEVMALFNGCRQVIYGFVPDCTQATLKAVIDNQEVSTMVSTADLNITTGKILHQLTARAIIQDWTDGLLAAERIEHEIVKKNRKNYIIKLSKEFSIITQFTSFVAVEKREEGEVMSASKNFKELVQKDSMDILDYMKWEDVKSRVCVKTSDQQDLMIDVDLNETFGQLKSKVSEITSKSVALYCSQDDLPVADEDCLWDHLWGKEAIIYAVEDTESADRVFCWGEAFSDDENDLCGVASDDDEDYHELPELHDDLALSMSSQLCCDLDFEYVERLESVSMYVCDESEGMEQGLEREREDEDMGFGLLDDDLRLSSSSSSSSSSTTTLLSADWPSTVKKFRSCKLQTEELPTELQQLNKSNELALEERAAVLWQDSDLHVLSSISPPEPKASMFDKEQPSSVEQPSFVAGLPETFGEAGCCLYSDPNLADLGAIGGQSETSVAAAEYDVSTELDEIQRDRRYEVSSLEHSVSPRKAMLERKMAVLKPMAEPRRYSKRAETAVELEMEGAIQVAAAPVKTSFFAAREIGGVSSFSAGGPASVKDAPPKVAPKWMLRASAPAPPAPLSQPSFQFQFGSTESASVSDTPQQPANVQAMFGTGDACITSSFGLAFEPAGSMPVDATPQPAPAEVLHEAPPPPTKSPYGILFRPGFGSTLYEYAAPMHKTSFGMERAVAAPLFGSSAGFRSGASASRRCMPPQPAPFQASATSFGFESKSRESASVCDATPRSASAQVSIGFASPPESFIPSSSLESGFASAGSASVSGMPAQPAPVQAGLFGTKEAIEPPSVGFGFGSTGSEALSQPVQTFQESAATPMLSFKSKVRSSHFLAASDAPPLPQAASRDLPPPPPPCGFAVGSLGLFSASDTLAPPQPVSLKAIDLASVRAKPKLTSEHALFQLPPVQTMSSFLPPPPPQAPPPPPCGFAVGSLGLFSARHKKSASPQPMLLGAMGSAPGLASTRDASSQPRAAAASAAAAADRVSVPLISQKRSTLAWTGEETLGSAETTLQEESDSANEFSQSARRFSLGSASRSSDLTYVTGLPAQKNLPHEYETSELQPTEFQAQGRQRFHGRHKFFVQESSTMCYSGSPIVPSSVEQGSHKAKLHPNLPLTIGIGTLGVIMTPVFTRNTKLPTAHIMYLTTCFDYQTSVRVKVYRGEHKLTAYNVMLGELELTGLESKEQGKTKIEATFEIDEHGRLKVKITSLASGCSNETTMEAVEDSAEDVEALIRSMTETNPVEPMDLRTMKAFASSWDVCLYEEGQSDLAEDSSLNNLNISTGKVIWTEENWRKLSSLHHKCRSASDGIFWELDDELGSLLCVDVKKLDQILVENGLKSLGSQAASDVRRLLANFLVLFSSQNTRCLPEGGQPNISLGPAMSEMTFKGVPRDFYFLPAKAARFFRRTDEKHPLIYCRLNLGRSWAEAASNLLDAGFPPRNLAGLG